MINQNKKKRILEVLRKYNAKMKQLAKAKLKVVNDIQNERSQEDLAKIRTKLKNL